MMPEPGGEVRRWLTPALFGTKFPRDLASKASANSAALSYLRG